MTTNIEEKQKQNGDDFMPISIRLTKDQVDRCDVMRKKLGIDKRSDFLRDAVDFYIEWLCKGSSEKFLTPALESVISGKVRDSEERLARLLFKMAVDQNILSHIIANAYDYDEDELGTLRKQSVREVTTTNGTLRTDEIILSKNR